MIQVCCFREGLLSRHDWQQLAISQKSTLHKSDSHKSDQVDYLVNLINSCIDIADSSEEVQVSSLSCDLV